MFCEKPIAFSRDELDSLIALAKQNHCFFQEAMTVTYMPNFSILKQAIQDKHPHLLTCDLSQYSIQYDALKQGEISNVFAKQMKGGALYDLGVYCLHFVYGILGYPKAMTKYDVRYTNGIDTSGVIVMQYEQCNAIISYGKDSKEVPILESNVKKGIMIWKELAADYERLFFMMNKARMRLVQKQRKIITGMK